MNGLFNTRDPLPFAELVRILEHTQDLQSVNKVIETFPDLEYILEGSYGERLVQAITDGKWNANFFDSCITEPTTLKQQILDYGSMMKRITSGETTDFDSLRGTLVPTNTIGQNFGDRLQIVNGQSSYSRLELDPLVRGGSIISISMMSGIGKYSSLKIDIGTNKAIFTQHPRHMSTDEYKMRVSTNNKYGYDQSRIFGKISGIFSKMDPTDFTRTVVHACKFQNQFWICNVDEGGEVDSYWFLPHGYYNNGETMFKTVNYTLNDKYVVGHYLSKTTSMLQMFDIERGDPVGPQVYFRGNELTTSICATSTHVYRVTKRNKLLCTKFETLLYNGGGTVGWYSIGTCSNSTATLVPAERRFYGRHMAFELQTKPPKLIVMDQITLEARLYAPEVSNDKTAWQSAGGIWVISNMGNVVFYWNDYLSKCATYLQSSDKNKSWHSLKQLDPAISQDLQIADQASTAWPWFVCGLVAALSIANRLNR